MTQYSGDVSVEETWQALSDDPKAVLIDVRTNAEWAFVGYPNLSSVGQQPHFISWQVFPTMELNMDFVGELEKNNIPKDSSLYFLCRSGVRSASAAIAAYGSGYTQSYNIAGGFEGDKSAQHHRGEVNGWKAANLPWVQQ